MKRLVVFILLLNTLYVYSQRHNFRSLSEVGFMAGGMYYIGDLNPTKHFHRMQPAASLIFRYTIHSRLTFRLNGILGSIEGKDSDNTKFPSLINRNLSFKSEIYELSSGVEFTYFPHEIGHRKYKSTAYLMLQLGVFHMNPKAVFEGIEYELQPLGTEGQGTELSEAKPYSLTQVAVPVGLGYKVNLGKNASLGVEYGIRFVLSDYLDDVSSETFVDSKKLREINGPIAAGLSNRNIDGSSVNRRGNVGTRDWYAFCGLQFTFRLGNPDRCPQRY